MRTKKSSSLAAAGPEPCPVLTRLFQARNEWDRLYQLSNLLKEARIDLPDFFDSPVIWSTICREADPEKLAWLLAREISKRTGGHLPRSLAPFANRPDFEAEDQAENEARFKTELAEWLDRETETLGSSPRRELRVIWKIEAGADPLQNRVQIELRVNSAKLKEGSRNFFQVRGLCNELANHPEMFSPEDSALLRWLSDYTSLLLTEKSKNQPPFLTDNRSLLIWLQQWGQNERCRFEDGTPVQFSHITARIVPSLKTEESGARNTAVQLGFDVVAVNGLREPLSSAKLFLSAKSDTPRLDPELVWVAGTFYRLAERPPRSVIELSLKNGPSKLNSTSVRQFLPKLLRRYPILQPQVRVHLRQVPAKPKFYFTIDADDWLCIRLQAVARSGSDTWEWGAEGWTKITKSLAAGKEMELFASAQESIVQEKEPLPPRPESVTAEIWDEIPAEEDMAGAQEWLKRWEGESGELCGHPDDPGWWLLLNGRRLPLIFAVWQDRDPKWECYGNKKFHQLLSGKKRALPKLKIHSTGIDWFTVKAEWEDESLKLTPSDWQKFRQTEDPFIKLGDGGWMAREDMEQLNETLSAFAEIGVEITGGEQKINTLQIAGAQAGAWNKLQNISDPEIVKEVGKLREAVDQFTGIATVPVPETVKAELRPYQQEGLNFLSYASQWDLGAILADEMGLGKTLQALAWLEHLRKKHGPHPSLVVCPASVVFNWKREAAQFTPHQKVLLLTAGDARHELRSEIPQHDLIVTNYALLRRDLASLKKFSFRSIILDEAQNIKNPDSMVAKAAKELQAQHRLALTGTPLENRLLDIWSLVDFIHPGYLPVRTQFSEQYDQTPQARALLSSRLRPLLLRRLKSQVARDLPDRIEERIDCDLTEGQRKFYLAELQRSRQMLQDFDPATGQGRQRMHILAALTRLRQICCHPALAGGKGNLGSGKTSSFFELLEPLCASGHKVLIFSQFVEMLKILRTELEQRGIPNHILTGQTTHREEVVQAFQNDPNPCVFLLSLKAAGTGLNLTAASYVILYDPWWNPAVEAQAIDRTHRIGQDRTVIAYRLVTRDTVEEKIWELQRRKSQLVKDVLGEQGFAGSLTKSDLEFLFGDEELVGDVPG